MRINLMAGGFGGSVGALQTDVDRLYTNIDVTIGDLRDLKKQILDVPGGTRGLDTAVTGINNRIRTEETKKTDLENISLKISNFLDNTVQTDSAVARTVRANQKEFFNDFPWLRPQNTNTQPSIWEQLAEAWGDFWDTAVDWLSDLVGNIVDFLKEHALEIIIGLVAIVVAAFLTWLTGGAFLAALGAFLKAAALQALVGGIISGVIALFTGGDFWDAFGDGFAKGFMWAGIFSVISTTITAIRGIIHGANYVDDVVGAADDVAGAADDIAGAADDVAGAADDIAGAADDVAGAADDIAGAADDVAGAADDVAGAADDVAGAADDVVTKYPKSVLDDLQMSDDFHPNFKEHIFEGQINGRGSATGFHYEGVDDVAGRVVDGTQTVVNKFGAYNAQVTVNGVPKTQMSTFFPRNWSPQKVVDSVQQAFQNKRLVTLPGGRQQWVGICDDGMEIVLGLRNGQIYTAWPFVSP